MPTGIAYYTIHEVKMTNKIEEKLFRYALRGLPNGKYNVLKIDRDDPDAYAELCLPDKTEHEIREWYRTMWNLSDIEIDERIATAQRELEMSGRK